jgi:hypothetical protein
MMSKEEKRREKEEKITGFNESGNILSSLNEGNSFCKVYSSYLNF